MEVTRKRKRKQKRKQLVKKLRKRKRKWKRIATAVASLVLKTLFTSHIVTFVAKNAQNSWKIQVKIKKTQKTQENPIKPNKTQKNQKNRRAGFFLKKPAFWPTLPKRIQPKSVFIPNFLAKCYWTIVFS